MLPLEGLHVKQAVNRGIWVRTQHLLSDREKSRRTLIYLAGRRTFRLQTDFSQQSDIKYANPHISPYLAVALFERVHIFVFRVFFVMYTIWMNTKQLYITYAKRIHAYTHIHAYKYIRTYL
jgi:hypothetical protein